MPLPGPRQRDTTTNKLTLSSYTAVGHCDRVGQPVGSRKLYGHGTCGGANEGWSMQWTGEGDGGSTKGKALPPLLMATTTIFALWTFKLLLLIISSSFNVATAAVAVLLAVAFFSWFLLLLLPLMMMLLILCSGASPSAAPCPLQAPKAVVCTFSPFYTLLQKH